VGRAVWDRSVGRALWGRGIAQWVELYGIERLNIIPQAQEKEI